MAETSETETQRVTAHAASIDEKQHQLNGVRHEQLTAFKQTLFDTLPPSIVAATMAAMPEDAPAASATATGAESETEPAQSNNAETVEQDPGSDAVSSAEPVDETSEAPEDSSEAVDPEATAE